jgi:hypothetical protein
MTGRQRSHPVYVKFRRRAEDRDDGAQHRLPGAVPGLALRHAQAAAAGLLDRWRGILRQCLLPQRRACLADAITTVSPSYAQEICTPGIWHGPRRAAARQALQRAERNRQRHRRHVWNPATDPHIAPAYGAKTLPSAPPTSAPSRQRFGLDEGDGLLHGVVSRLTWQKGMDIFAATLTGLRRAVPVWRSSAQANPPSSRRSSQPPTATRPPRRGDRI